MKAEMGSIFIVYRSLLHPKLEQIRTVPRSDFELLGALKLDPRTQTTSYNDALYFWIAILSKNTKSIVTLSSRSLHLNKFITKKYQNWWSKVTISDLRANVALFQLTTGHDPSKSKNTRANTSKEGSDFEDQDSDAKQIGESLDTRVANRQGDTIKNDDSDKDSEANFKHRGHKKQCLLEIVFSMTSQAIQTCLTLTT
ncbi:hypothetical protein Cgig2_010314 [Carnegiea gigantea]|uniref:Uncharacterized protein n=1 Tax=Carnegiea gigantea TaxID=171969 RepID=A0A9Q1QKY0_9CARY|nr:hypothetical protein Cgig2_010314 [Carnegiea gigantea]